MRVTTGQRINTSQATGTFTPKEDKMRVLVTGHKGFIGTHVFSTLLEEGYDVVGWDLKDGNDVTQMLPSDLNDGRSRQVDVIFHLAAMPRVPLSIERPEYTNWHNVEGTVRVLWAAHKAGVKRVIYSSSSSIYGQSHNLPINEETKPNPMSPYAVQKLTGEHYCKVFANVYELETVSLRYFNVYGEGMKADDPYSPCIAIFLDQKRKDEPLTILGGKQKRDFTYVGDVVKANLLAMTSDKVGKGEAINIGGGKNYSIDEIDSFISDKTIHLPQRKGEPMNTLANIEKAKYLLRWEPTVNLKSWLLDQMGA